MVHDLKAEDLIPQLLQLCRSAGEAILTVYGASTMAVIEKSDSSPVTQADTRAHFILQKGLETLTPSMPILSEEGDIPPFEERQHWSTYWLLDPLDGTREFIEGNDEFTVNIALIEKGVPVLGVIYVPVTGLSYWGAAGCGAFKQERGAQATAIYTRDLKSRLAQGLPLEVVVSRRVGGKAQAVLLANLARRLGPCTRTTIGSSLKFCLVAEGVADFYPRLGPTSEWDTAAAQAILEAAGGRVVDNNFSPLSYNHKECLLNPSFYAFGDPALAWDQALVAP